jgi:methylase of polypeptide subunit release factors
MKSGSTRQHAEWRSLIEVSGPFLALEVLAEVFPQGLPAPETEKHVRARLRTAYAEWEVEFSEEGERSPAIHDAWVRFVLEDVLGFQARELLRGQDLPSSFVVPVAEHGETLKPDLAIAVEGKPRVLVAVWPKTQQLGRAPEDARWAASPAARMMTLLHATNTRLGLVTNGEAWMLVHARPGETTTYATWWADVWRSEPLTLTAFRALLGRPAFVERPEDESLEVLFERSAAYAHEVTDQLGLQVRHAVELLVHALDKLDRTHQGTVLRGVDEKTLYESAVTVMMRLVFLLCAEERRLLLSGNDAWDTYYSPGTLREQLRAVADQQGEEVLERRQAAWARLLATFRAVYGGVRHSDFQLMAYGGSLFDPDRYPFLEGRKPGTSWKDTEAMPPAIDDRTVLNLLDSIQVLRLNGEPIRLSFRALDVEQIGHVYEGLLDHTAVRATTPVLGLGGKHEPEIPLDALQREARKGREHFLGWLGEETGRSGAKTLERDAFEYVLEDNEADRLHMVCEGETLYGEVERFAGLLRRDPNGYPVVYPAGARYVTQGSDRRSTGTHYTPRSLTEPVVQYTLEPLVYVGPAEGKPRSEWKLKSTRELLSLRICDVAMGSGAFLVQACRYLAERVLESWGQRNQDVVDTPLFAPLGEESTGDPAELHLPKDPEERLILARRLVADRCLYGVDKNAMAVEMAKLSLWLTTLQKDRPFTFLDHALKPGDSLLGLTSMDQLEQFHIRPEKGRTRVLGSTEIRSWLKDAVAIRQRLERRQVVDIRDAEQKAWWHTAAEGKLAPTKVVADLIVGAALTVSPNNWDTWLSALAMEVSSALTAKLSDSDREYKISQLRQRTAAMLNGLDETSNSELRPFHWVLEFPEVFTREEAGFDAIIGNPPYLGGSRISTELGNTYSTGLKRMFPELAGKVDLVLFFLAQGLSILSKRGTTGVVSTFRLPEGDNASRGVQSLIKSGLTPYRADRNIGWPGKASVRICRVWLAHNNGCYPPMVDGTACQSIGPDLRPIAREASNTSPSQPHVLQQNKGLTWLGAKPDSLGFMLSETEAAPLLKDKSERSVLRKYLTGSDLLNRIDRTGARWVIDFSGLSEEQARQHPRAFALVRERVFESRMKLQRKSYKDRWWQFTEPQLEAHQRARRFARVPGISRVTKHFVWEWIDPQQVISDSVAFLLTDDAFIFGILSSIVHETWAYRTSGRFGKGDSFRYSHTRSMNTFPLASRDAEVANAATHLSEYRIGVCQSLNKGLTTIYDLVHDPQEKSSEVRPLRKLHAELNQLALKAYGWTDLSCLEHGFHKTREGIRFTLGPEHLDEIHRRLVVMNVRFHNEEGTPSPQGPTPDAKAKVPGAKKPGHTTSKKSSSKDFFEG